jgi:hypothetical protein
MASFKEKQELHNHFLAATGFVGFTESSLKIDAFNKCTI